ncbi:MAG: hypothetical protein ACRDRL_27405 [Sciscionella sp.]
MKITFLGTTSTTGQCPTVYATDRDTYVVQGAKVLDDEALAELRKRANGIPDHETVVEIPKALVEFFPETTG